MNNLVFFIFPLLFSALLTFILDNFYDLSDKILKKFGNINKLFGIFYFGILIILLMLSKFISNNLIYLIMGIILGLYLPILTKKYKPI